MRDVSKGRFERMQCVRCGAHALVPEARASDPVRCGVCGGAEFVPVPEPHALNGANFSHRTRESA